MSDFKPGDEVTCSDATVRRQTGVIVTEEDFRQRWGNVSVLKGNVPVRYSKSGILQSKKSRLTLVTPKRTSPWVGEWEI